MITAKEIIAHVSNPTEADRALINKAYDFAKKAHTGQMRKSGEEYMSHLAAVAFNLAEMGLGPRTIVLRRQTLGRTCLS